jgi:phosphoribosylformylglycinamidine cyclo-ligase
MFRTFNMGVGMVIAVPAEDAEEAVRVAQDLGEQAFVIGRVAEGPREVVWA